MDALSLILFTVGLTIGGILFILTFGKPEEATGLLKTIRKHRWKFRLLALLIAGFFVPKTENTRSEETGVGDREIFEQTIEKYFAEAGVQADKRREHEETKYFISKTGMLVVVKGRKSVKRVSLTFLGGDINNMTHFLAIIAYVVKPYCSDWRPDELMDTINKAIKKENVEGVAMGNCSAVIKYLYPALHVGFKFH